MALGPGKYDAWCTRILSLEDADAVCLVVIGGARGPGASLQISGELLAAGGHEMIADALDAISRGIRGDARPQPGRN